MTICRFERFRMCVPKLQVHNKQNAATFLEDQKEKTINKESCNPDSELWPPIDPDGVSRRRLSSGSKELQQDFFVLALCSADHEGGDARVESLERRAWESRGGARKIFIARGDRLFRVARIRILLKPTSAARSHRVSMWVAWG